jgi:hypothetical protein
MAVETTHEEYDEYKPQWERMRDCIEGQDAIHAAGTKYLPKLDGQGSSVYLTNDGGLSNTEYAAYVKRALFYNASARTIDGLSGMVFRKEPVSELPPAMEPYMDSITLDGLSLQGFAEQIVEDILAVGRCGILVDYPRIESDALTVAQAEALNIRPFLKHYTAESIINWRTRENGNKLQLSQVRLMEEVEEVNGDFDSVCIGQIRVLDLDDAGYYRQRLYRQKQDATQKKEWEQFGPDMYPTMRGVKMREIPFFFVGVKNNSPDIEEPPLLDLADANLSHYRTTADLEHGAHYTALPTAVIVGMQDEAGGGDFFIGSRAAWLLRDPNAKAFFLEFTGRGLGALEARLAAKEQYMAALGARMLAPDKKGIEAAETARIRGNGEASVLSSIAQSVSMSIEKALAVYRDWLGISGDIKFDLNTDFLPTIMDAQTIRELVSAWQQGAIGFTDLVHNFKRGEIVEADRTIEDIQAEVEVQDPFPAQGALNA